ncbi:MAG: RNA methyltransferase [Gemmatimonadota bacterium]|nr:MAG: RNA methyltransferase [Gemmatimonadota bacterium]
MGSKLVSLARNLRQRKGRSRRGLTLAEGVRLVEEAIVAGVAIRGVLVDEFLASTPHGGGLLRQLAAHAIPVEQISSQTLAGLAATESPQGVVAVIEQPRSDLSAIAPVAWHPALVLDAVQDPGNVGTLLRTAFALGCPGAVLLKGTADPANPKALRAAAGASFRLPLATASDEQLAGWLKRNDIVLWVSDAAGTPIRRLEAPPRLAVVVGNEGAGVRPVLAALSQERVAVPLARGAESLNVAVAAGIILNEVQSER